MAQGKKTIIDYELVEMYAGIGMTDADIALLLDIVPETFARLKQKDENLVNAIKRGKSKAKVSIAKALFNKARDGNVTAMIFWLCNRAPEEWKNIQKIEGRVESKDFQIEIVRVRDDKQEKKEQS